MSAFEVGADVLFSDPNSSLPALHKVGGIEASTACRVILYRPDEVATFGESRAIRQGYVIDVRKSEVAAPAKGDHFLVGPVTYKITADPKASESLGLIWRCEVAPIP